MAVSDNYAATNMYRTNVVTQRRRRRNRRAMLIFVIVMIFVFTMAAIGISGTPDASVSTWLSGLVGSVGAGLFCALLYLLLDSFAEG